MWFRLAPLMSRFKAKHSLGFVGVDDTGITGEGAPNLDAITKIALDQLNRRLTESSGRLCKEKRFMASKIRLECQHMRIHNVPGVCVRPHYYRLRILGGRCR